MSKAIDKLDRGHETRLSGRTCVGLPYLAKVPRQAVVARNVGSISSCENLAFTAKGSMVMQAAPLIIVSIRCGKF